VAEFEIVVCNDGSQDRTGNVLLSLAKNNPELRPIEFERNRGAAAAMNAAIRGTRLEWVLLFDSDGQFPIESFGQLLAGIRREGTRAAMGIRQRKGTLFPRFGTWSSGIACNLLYGTRMQDFNSACKLVDGRIVRSLNLEAKGINYSTEVTARLLEHSVVITEVNINYRPRATGTSSMRAARKEL
jgi:glycosyltransferase involved in cell wall biosynthesis